MTSNFEEHEQLSDFKTVLDKQLLDNSPIAPTIDTGNPASRRGALQVAGTAFVVLFCIVGLALWGLPFYYDFMVQQFGWTRAQVTSGNALSKLVVGPVFGFIAGWIIDRFGPRRVMMAGILMAGGALVGLGWVSTLGMFYLFYFFNALGYVCGGPLPNQVLLSRWFDKSRGKAMGFAYLGIGIGGATVPWISHALVQHFGWQAALRLLGLLIIVVSLPLGIHGEGGASAILWRWHHAADRRRRRPAFKTLPFTCSPSAACVRLPRSAARSRT